MGWLQQGSGTWCVTVAWGCAEWTAKYTGGDSWILSSLCSISVIGAPDCYASLITRLLEQMNPP